MMRSAALAIALVMGLSLAWFACKTPSPVSASAPAASFSAERAFADVAIIGKASHPVGSPTHDYVRDYVAERLRSLGLQVRIQKTASVRKDSYDDETWIQGAEVENIIGVLPGRDPEAKALVISAHYDSALNSPGAADDTAGVASALEAVRALEIRGKPLRDVIVLITDGEELGLLGAKAFYDKDPLAAHVGAVLNMDTRGGGGRAFMFETGKANGAMIDVFRRSAVHPSSNSLAVFLYEHMPNGTDFTLSKDKGIAGLNYAFIGRPFDYHAASSTPERLEKGALQNMGEQVLAAANVLAFANQLPPRKPDAVYSDLFGMAVVAYPAAMGWLVLGLGAGLAGFAAWRFHGRDELGWVEAARGAAGAMFLLLLAAAVLHLARVATLVPSGFADEKTLYAQFPLFEAALGALGLGLTLRAFGALASGTHRVMAAGVAVLAGLLDAIFGHWLAGLGIGVVAALVALFAFGTPVRAVGAWAGFAVVTLVFALVCQITAPTIAFLFAWPLVLAGLAGAAAALAGGFEQPPALAASTVLGALGLGWALYLAHGVALGVGADITAALGLMLFLAVVPLAALLGVQPLALKAGVGAMAVGWVLIAVVAFHDPASVRTPRPTEVAYVIDRDHQSAWRIAKLTSLDRWSKAVLAADGAAVEKKAFAPITRAPVWAAKAPLPAGSGPPPVAATAGGFDLTAPAGSRVDLSVSAPATAVIRLGDQTLPAGKAGGPPHVTHIIWTASTSGGAAPFGSVVAAGPVEIGYGVTTGGWPKGAKPLPARPADAMPWYLSDSTVEIGATRGDGKAPTAAATGTTASPP